MSRKTKLDPMKILQKDFDFKIGSIRGNLCPNDNYQHPVLIVGGKEEIYPVASLTSSDTTNGKKNIVIRKPKNQKDKGIYMLPYLKLINGKYIEHLFANNLSNNEIQTIIQETQKPNFKLDPRKSQYKLF